MVEAVLRAGVFKMLVLVLFVGGVGGVFRGGLVDGGDVLYIAQAETGASGAAAFGYVSYCVDGLWLEEGMVCLGGGKGVCFRTGRCNHIYAP